MVTTATMQKIAEKSMSADTGEAWILSYFVQTFTKDDGEEYYGLRVEKRRDSETEIEEAEETGGITECRDEIFAIAQAFAEGTVPPLTLLEIADDWMSND
ncbi:MAG: DUF6514 family protein [Defluviitaleaceae bacterium]|nr:DUF6514 family protein [Defluviitaleaceae bacterium]